MAAEASSRILNNDDVIDLTLSDDEDLYIKRQSALHQLGSQSPSVLSNRRSFVGDALDAQSLTKRPKVTPVLPPSRGSSIFLKRSEHLKRANAVRSGPVLNVASFNLRHSVGSSSPIPPPRPIFPPRNQSAGSENSLKRRKTDHGVESLRVSQILPPAPHHQRAEPNIPPQNTQHLHPVNLHKRILPPPRTVLSGTNRTQASKTSRVSPDGQIQKTVSRKAAQVRVTHYPEARLHDQALAHIQDSLRDHLNPHGACREFPLLKKTDPSFDDDSHQSCQSESGNSTQEPEENLKLKSTAVRDNPAIQTSKGTSAKPLAPQNISNLSLSRAISKYGTRYYAKPGISSNSSSTDEEPFFERQHKHPPEPHRLPHETISRKQSPSPTTSFSTDQTDAERTNDIQNTGYNANSPSKILRRSKRNGLSSTTTTSKRIIGQSGNTALVKTKRNFYSESHVKLGLQLQPKQKSDVRVPKSNPTSVNDVRSLSLAIQRDNVRRPYISFEDRDNIQRGMKKSRHLFSETLSPITSSLHVDFSMEEMKVLFVVIVTTRNQKITRMPLDSEIYKNIQSLLAGQEYIIRKVLNKTKSAVHSFEARSNLSPDVGSLFLRNRNDEAILDFLRDAAAGRIVSSSHFRPPVAKSPRRHVRSVTQCSPLFRQREIWGLVPNRMRGGHASLRTSVTSRFEDSLVRQSEWTDCCGDISTITWTSNSAFICGATSHSDSHNMQYNKPGNLVVGSTVLGNLRSVSDHRILRPIVAQGTSVENSLDSMRQTQSPWLYTSVVSTAHGRTSQFTFTASFDETVKVWRVSNDGSSMDIRGSWHHDGKVNFVVTSEHHDRVATASDVSVDAVRVYELNRNDISGSSFDSYCGTKAREQGGEFGCQETWTYFPATIQWGRAQSVAHLLLVGYSPRSLTTHENDIPDEKKNSGVLCMWNVLDGSRLIISSARTQNVFEVIWHPTQPCFLAATSPCGSFEPVVTKTQIRLFAQNEVGAFLPIQALDCPAADINELTIRPNCSVQCYVTASCTDGNTYVYDTSQGDQALHVLQHGDSLDNPTHELPRELADTGVKFAAWGQSTNRFYTGSSDGKVKAWDITAPPGQAFVRNVLVVAGGISTGAFSTDFSQLAIGDATGKVHLLGMNESSIEENWYSRAGPTQFRGSAALQYGGVLPPNLERPKVIIPHPEPPPPKVQNFDAEIDQTGPELAHEYLENGLVKLHVDPRIGAIQGPNYSDTGWYRHEAHEDFDGSKPLLPEWQAKQRAEMQHTVQDLRLPILPRVAPAGMNSHQKNTLKDFDYSKLTMETQNELARDRVELNWDDQKFAHEEMPSRRADIFKEDRIQRQERKRDEQLYKHI